MSEAITRDIAEIDGTPLHLVREPAPRAVVGPVALVWKPDGTKHLLGFVAEGQQPDLDQMHAAARLLLATHDADFVEISRQRRSHTN